MYAYGFVHNSSSGGYAFMVVTETAPTAEQLLRVEEVAAHRLHIGRTVVYDLIRRGEIRSVLIGKSRRVPASAVDEYITRLLVEQSAELVK
jgi:excisionase family DNA binding protein